MSWGFPLERDVFGFRPCSRDGVVVEFSPGSTLQILMLMGSVVNTSTVRLAHGAADGYMDLMDDTVRGFTDEDMDALVEVSRAASELFTEWGLDVLPGNPVGTIRRAEHVWVAGRPAVGFAVTETVDGVVHLGELAVHPDCGRRGIGTRLVDAVIQHAVQVGSAAVTLTTFRDVPWNAPWYRARGFTIFSPGQWGPELQQVWQRETASGIAVAPRVAMRRDLVESVRES